MSNSRVLASETHALDGGVVVVVCGSQCVYRTRLRYCVSASFSPSLACTAVFLSSFTNLSVPPAARGPSTMYSSTSLPLHPHRSERGCVPCRHPFGQFRLEAA